jgi:hypothetical protein
MSDASLKTGTITENFVRVLFTKSVARDIDAGNKTVV